MTNSAEQTASPLQLNADFGQRAVMRPTDACWKPSPLPGVERWMLDRVGGEEILVLDGVFCDESGAYPKGSWLRSPRWSRHAPFTGPAGALIYVKVGHLGAALMAD